MLTLMLNQKAYYNTSMAKVLKIHTIPENEDVLRAHNQEISFPLSTLVKRLIEDIKITVKKAPGIGLAAPQVGQNLTLAIINLEEFGIKTFALINPRVISKSIKKTEMEEGCLSIPGFFGKVKRPARVSVEAFREDGKKIIIKGDKLLAKVLQHEIDHLNGVLIADRIKIIQGAPQGAP